VVGGLRPQDCRAEARAPGAEVSAGAGLTPGPGLPPGPGLTATVLVYENLLEYGLATVELAGVPGRVVVQVAAGQTLAAGDAVSITAPARRVYLFDGQSGGRLR
jgi:hypothetical protein